MNNTELQMAWPLVSEYHRDYKVLRQIASGGYGSVHCVQRRDTKVILAAKYVKSAEEDLRREIEALLALRKSSLILQFVEFYISEPPKLSQSVLVTEYLAGGDLIERTSASDYVLTEAKCRTIVRQICRGVQYIHSQNFLHLDIKPFNIVFTKRKDDYDLRIIDFGLARELKEDQISMKLTKFSGTVEYMSPEVMNVDHAWPASDIWGIGVITYQLLSGGISPFFAVNRFRTMSRINEVDYSLDQAELCKTSDEAKDFISRLLLRDPKKRLTATQCLDHPWLKDEKLYLGILQTLETIWMRKCLARRRWYRLFNALRVMRRVKLMSETIETSRNRHWTGTSSSDDDMMVNGIATNGNLPYLHPLSQYYNIFEKIHLIVNNGTFGTVFNVQHKENGDSFAARHVKALNVRSNLRDEASILWQLRNVPELIQLQGLYEGPQQSVLVLEDLIGGDLAERVCKPWFELNETKCKQCVQQICRGLAFIHKNNIVHLDIKPFTLVFANNEENSSLKIVDFALAKRLTAYSDPNLATKSIRVTSLNSTTVEFLAPEMIECTYATFATDAWNVGIIAYMLVTGGKSPFYEGNRFKTTASVLSCKLNLSGPEFSYISDEAKNFIKKLLKPIQSERMSMVQCLEHKWLTKDIESENSLKTLEEPRWLIDDKISEIKLQTLETRWMKKLLARRRWHRWYNAVRATQRIRKLSATSNRALMN